MTNINPNNDVGKINHNIKKGNKVNKQEKPVAQTKQVEASSLNALSAYGKANINFKGNTNLYFEQKKETALDVIERTKKMPVIEPTREEIESRKEKLINDGIDENLTELISKLNNVKYERAKYLIYEKLVGLNCQTSMFKDVINLLDDNFCRIDELLSSNCTTDDLANLAELPEGEYQIAIQLLKEDYTSSSLLKCRDNNGYIYKDFLSEKDKIKKPRKKGFVDYTEITPTAKKYIVNKVNSDLRLDKPFTIDSNISDIACAWKEEYRKGGPTPLMLDNQLNNILIENSCDRYISKNKEPLARWMEVPNLSYFIETIPEEGEIYAFDRFQSFAKSTYGAEHNRGGDFHDGNTNKNFKFVVHPNSELTNAYDIGDGKFGNQEVLYKAGAQFKVISKGIEVGEQNGIKNRMYVVHLKELSTDEVKQEIQKPSYQQIKPITQETKTTSAEAFNFLKYIDEKYKTKETEFTLASGIKSTFKEYIGSKMGTNAGALVKDKKTDTLYYAKFGGKQSKVEVLASKLYKMAGINTAEMKLIKSNNTIGLISKYLVGSQSALKGTKDVYKGFGMDAFLANWDAVISGNIREYNGQTYRIDMGGSLDFRAQGEKKYFNGIVTELKTLLEPSREAAYFYEGMTHSDLIDSIQRVVDIKDSDLIELLKNEGMTEYKDVLLQRKQYMTKFLETAKNTPYTQQDIHTFV